MARRRRSAYKTSKGNKRYLKRDKRGRIVDNQGYKRSHGRDVRRKSKEELNRGNKALE